MNEAFLSRYGNPDANGDGILDAQWFADCIRVFPLPYPMPISWGDHSVIMKFQAHILAGPKIVAALSKMREYAQIEANEENEKLNAIVWMRKFGYDVWGGCWNFRLVRGGNVLSDHSWGTAVDLCPARGAMGVADDTLYFPPWIIKAFEEQGFQWGGHFTRTDGMHLQLIS
jgi:hypothetical protein